MITRTVSQIADMCGAILKSENRELLIKGVSKDSRHIDGELFIPIVGENFDGHQYIEQAIANGAKATLWNKRVPIPEHLKHIPFLLVRDTVAALQKLATSYRTELFTRIVAITGSNGKTTTKDMTAAILSSQYKVSKTIGNLNNHIGLPLTILSLEEETDIAVLEMGMSGFGEIELLTKIASPDIAIITNIGDAHMEQLGSREGIAKAKVEILQGLDDDGVFIYNSDEPLIEQAVKEALLPYQFKQVSFGFNGSPMWKAEHLAITPFDATFTVLHENKASSIGELTIPITGKHNVGNALAAIAVARLFGISAEQIKDGFKQLEVSAMRAHPSKAKCGATIINDAYNANPTAMKVAIQAISEYSGYNRKWVVLGDMLELGEHEHQLHAEVGAYAVDAGVDVVIGFGPRSIHLIEEVNRLSTTIIAKHFATKDELFAFVLKEIKADDIVLVKGSRGMKMEEVVEVLEKG